MRVDSVARRGLALLLAGVLGCASVGPDYQRPDVAAPSAWGELAPAQQGRSEVLASGTPAGWWISFDDPVLGSIIERALRSNLTLQQAEARVREARAARRIAAADLWPQIRTSGSYTRSRSSENGTGSATPGTWSNLFEAGFDAQWELDVFGGNRRAAEAGAAAFEAALSDRNDVLVSLMGEVGLEYVTYRSLQQRIALTQQNLSAQQQTLDLTRRLFDAGLAPELDVQRASAQVASTAATIPPLEQQAAQAMHTLGVLIGAPPMTLQSELAPVGAIPQLPGQVPIGVPSELLLRRPDIARAERALASATAQIGVATRDLYPRFFLGGFGGLQSVDAADFFKWQSRVASLGPSVTWPIFEGGRIRANVELQTAKQQELLAAYRDAVLQAFQDVEDALTALADQQAARDRLTDAVQANQRASELARNLYAQGLTDFLTVLVAEENLLTSQDALAQTQRDVALSLIALYKAVGGGWETATETAAR
jgi:NodT family efflux transporter outer membrane factor (OMF) lipoprotein